MSITHLHLKYIHPISSSRSAFQLPLFVSMASLTHMALSPMAGMREFDTTVAFSRVRATFPPSLILCLLALVGPKDTDEGYWVTEMIQTGLKFDKRIVLWSFVSGGNTDEVVIIDGGDGFQAWCGVQDGVQTFWDMGEAVLKRRQEPLGHV
ncbi:hypothetical protein DL96DRAFT_1595888 [Flagelloscypha sp. PMI_526]|nr:hypothetical protein DL96DRAFT_1595888 [Flagelloscypha sp. PMI_526]